MRFPAFRLIVKVVEQAAFRNEQSVALERPLCNKGEREGKKTCRYVRIKGRGKKKSSPCGHAYIYRGERERERQKSRRMVHVIDP